MNDRDRGAWPAGLNSEMSEQLWVPDGLIIDEEPANSDPSGSLISLAFIWDALRRRAWLWCLTAALGLLIGAGLYVKYPPAYQAQTSVLVVDGPNQNPPVEVLTDQSLAESEPVAARVVRELGLPQSVASLQAAYSVTPVTDTVLLFNVGAPSGAAAIQRAGALAASFLQYRAQYEQAQEQQLIAELNQQYNAAKQSLQAIDAQIGQLPTTQLTPAQKVQLDKLQTQQGDQKQIMQFVTGTQAATKASTAAMVTGSYVLDPPTLLAYSLKKGVTLYIVGGLFGGLAVGMAIVITAALLSGRLRRRDDVAVVLGAPVGLSVGSLRVPRWLPALRRQAARWLPALPWQVALPRQAARWLPALPRQAARRDRDLKRVTAYLQGALSGSSQGPASLAVVVVDDAHDVAPAVASLADSRAKEGRQVVVADLSSGTPLARLLGVREPGVHEVNRHGGRLLVAVPGCDDPAPAGPVGDGSPPTVWAEQDEAVVAAYSCADLLLTLVTLDPALGGDHLATWASEAIVVVTAGRSSVEEIHSVGEMIRLSGTRLDSAILIGADRSDASLGVLEPARPFVGAAGQHGKPERGGVPE